MFLLLFLFLMKKNLCANYSRSSIRTMRRIKMSYEIIFVDDGSTDKSFEVLTALHAEYPNIIKVIRFRRNFGKSAALSAGFKEAQGEFIITMDADLQDDPNEIPSLIETLGDSYDLVSGWKKKRHDSIIFTLPSHIANAITSKMTGLHIHDLNCGLKVYRKIVAKELKIYGDLYRYIPILAHQAGFRSWRKNCSASSTKIWSFKIYCWKILSRISRFTDNSFHSKIHPPPSASLWCMGNYFVRHWCRNRRISFH